MDGIVVRWLPSREAADDDAFCWDNERGRKIDCARTTSFTRMFTERFIRLTDIFFDSVSDDIRPTCVASGRRVTSNTIANFVALSTARRMPFFQHAFSVPGVPREAVAAFHQQDVAAAFPLLTPPTCRVAIDPEYCPKRMEEGCELRFTMWFGFFLFPIRWHAVHRSVSAACFTDELLFDAKERKVANAAGNSTSTTTTATNHSNSSTCRTSTSCNVPLESWVHHHEFEAVEGGGGTEVRDRIRYEYLPLGTWRGLLGRLLFNPMALWLLFQWRAYATRRALRSVDKRSANEGGDAEKRKALEKPLLVSEGKND